MKKLLRRTLTGVLAGAMASCALLPTLRNPGLGLLFAIAIGCAFALTTEPTRGTYVDLMMSGGALGVPLWAVVTVVAIPLLRGEMPEWSAEQMRHHFPALIGWVLYGAALGLLLQTFSDVAERLLGPEPASHHADASPKQRILILGGGFAGMKTAECLEQELRTNPSVTISLVSETNALLFTPMLAEVAGSSLEPSHISTPLRTSLHRTEFVRGRVAAVDLENKRVSLEASAGEGGEREIGYDHLVLALGSVSNYFGSNNIQKCAFNFKSLLDAIRIRNHVIEMFERADHESDPAARKALLTFVIAGGGFAGVELAGALNDFARGILADYPNLSKDDVRVVLVHARDRILPELSESLARYAQEKMAARGVEFRLNTRLADARPGAVMLSDGGIASETLAWTAGTAPNPLVKSLGLETDMRGAVVVTPALAVPGHTGMWALGDCAAVVDARNHKPCPPTAQFALREAAVLARNIRRSLEGKPTRGFHFDSLGALCVVGFQTACAELSVPFARSKSVRFSGLLAWLLWRGIYLGKLPGLERKIRVLVDWTVELFFPKDIVQTIDIQ